MSKRRVVALQAVRGAILGALCAIVAHVLGVQQLLRRPDVALYIPAAVVGAAVGVTRLRSLLWIAAGVIALVCLLVAYTPLVARMARPLIRRDAIPAHVDAIAVLSAGMLGDGLMRGETLDHLLTGLTLARRGLAPVLLVSREHRISQSKPVTDSADLQNVSSLIDTTTSIIFVDSVFTTRTEAMRMKAIARDRDWRTLAVVTSPMHTRRACATFEAVGFKVVCVPASVRGSGRPFGHDAEDRLSAFRSWLYETLATPVYRRYGWIP
jgi:uncharacterized SAM-binding protein YcdF (DUF218 family)